MVLNAKHEATGPVKRLVDIVAVTCAPDTRLRTVLSRINSAKHKFLIVVNADGGVLGTVTDGDIRRALLRGVTTDDLAAAYMQERPQTGRVGATVENARALQEVLGTAPFLPLVDDDGRLREILIADASQDRAGVALVMAGGRGERLGERTLRTPKPLLPIGDKPIIEHILHCLEEAEFTDIYVSVHHMADQIQRFIEERGSRAALRLVYEKDQLGTAGALGILPPEHRRRILVLNGDVLTRTDLAAFELFHQRNGYDATVAVAEYRIPIPYGVIRQSESGLFDGIDEKPELTRFVAAGMYYLSSSVISLVPPNRHMDMPELLNQSDKVGLKIGLFPIHEYWIDVGRPADLDSAANEHEAIS